MRALTYELDLEPSAVRARLAEAVDRPTRRYWLLPGTTSGRPIIGEVDGDRFWWRVRHQERSTFAPWLSGRILSGPRGATVIVELHSPLTRRAMVFIALVVSALFVLWLAVTPEKTPQTTLAAVVACSAVALFPWLGTLLLKDEQRTLRTAFEQLFPAAQATEAPRQGE